MPGGPATGSDGSAREAAEAVARHSYGRLVARLAARTRDVAGAEDALSTAFVAALVDWPANGVPRSPEAWLLSVARRKWIDAARRRRCAEEAARQLRLAAEERAAEAGGPPDERRALTFVCAHPAIDPCMRAPLVLQAVLGFDAADIGAAFEVSPAAMSQRLVRAKKRLREAGAPCDVPEGAELAARRDALLEAIEAALKGRRDPAGRAVRSRDSDTAPGRRAVCG